MTLEEPDNRTLLREGAATWALGLGATRETILIACDLLVDGADTPSLRILAGLPFDAEWWESRETLLSTFEELSMEFADPDSLEAKLLALAYLCRAFLRGELDVRRLTSWAYGEFSHDGPEITHELAMIEIEFDADEAHLWQIADLSDSAIARATAYLRSVE